MMITFKAIGVSTTSAKQGRFSAVVRFVQVDAAGQERPLSEQTFTVADKAALQTKCAEQIAILKQSHEEAGRAIDIAGKVLAEAQV